MSWDSTMTAVHSVITSGLNLPGDQVFWAFQATPGTFSNAQTYAQLEILGSDRKSAIRGMVTNLDETVTQAVCTEILFDVRVQIFNSITTGDSSAWALLQDLLSYTELLSTIEILDTSNITLVRASPVQHLPKRIDTRYQDRATTTLNFRTTNTVSSTVTSIRYVSGEGTITVPGGTSIVVPI